MSVGYKKNTRRSRQTNRPKGVGSAARLSIRITQYLLEHANDQRVQGGVRDARCVVEGEAPHAVECVEDVGPVLGAHSGEGSGQVLQIWERGEGRGVEEEEEEEEEENMCA